MLKYYSWTPGPFYAIGRKRFSQLKINEKSCNTSLVEINFLFDYVKSPSHVNKVSPFAHNNDTYSIGLKRFSQLKINEKSCNTSLVEINFLFDYVKLPSHVNKASPFAHNMPLVLYLYCAWMTLLGYVSVSLHIFQLLYTAMYFFIT